MDLQTFLTGERLKPRICRREGKCSSTSIYTSSSPGEDHRACTLHFPFCMSSPISLKRKISPPPPTRKSVPKDLPRKIVQGHDHNLRGVEDSRPSLAAIEAGEAQIQDHVEHFSNVLKDHRRSFQVKQPNLSIDGFGDLYKRNQHDNGHHFVIHQHDHPVAGRPEYNKSFVS